MNTQIPTNGPQVLLIPLGDVLPSATQPRKVFPKAEMDELVAGFREHGFVPQLSHLLVRPHPTEPGKKELICGERRWRAATICKLEWVPVVEKDFTDAEILELQLIENLQRSDLNAMEEADGYRRLIELRDEKGEPVHTRASIAKNIGKSVEHVGRRLALCRLRGTVAEEPLISGELPTSQARLIAGLATEATIKAVTEQVLRNPYGASPMPVQQLEGLIRDKYTRELRSALFAREDATLVPEVLKDGVRVMGGACGDCPFNSKNSGGGGRQNMCQNVECFSLKEAKGFERWQDTATDDGREALSIEENAEVFDFTQRSISPTCKYVALAQHPLTSELRPGQEAPGTWKVMLAGQVVPIALARDVDGKEHELVLRSVAIEAAVRNGHDVFRGTEKRGKTSKNDTVNDAGKKLSNEAKKVQDAAEERKTRINALVREGEQEALRKACQAERKLTPVTETLLVDSLIDVLKDLNVTTAVATAHGWKDEERSEAYLLKLYRKMPAELRVGFLVELGLWLRPVSVERVGEWGKALKVDLRGVRKAVEKRVAEEEKLAEEQKAIAEGLTWNKQRDKAEDFEWNGSNVCVNPDVCTLAFPKKAKFEASVDVARSEKGWHYGLSAGMMSGSMTSGGYAASRTSVAYSSRALALSLGIAAIAERYKGEKLSAEAQKLLWDYKSFTAVGAPAVVAGKAKAKKALAALAKKGGAK